MPPLRERLPNRRRCETTTLEVAGQRFAACVGFDRAGWPREVFLSGAKDGSGMSSILEDASVVISVALQHGVTAAALSHSIGRVPEALDGPPTLAASPIGGVLDLVAQYERTCAHPP
jgi:hypothetical protein